MEAELPLRITKQSFVMSKSYEWKQRFGMNEVVFLKHCVVV